MSRGLDLLDTKTVYHGNMKKKDSVIYVCSNCGNETPRWEGQCPSCREWNTLKEVKSLKLKVKSRRHGSNTVQAVALGDVQISKGERIQTGIGEVDRCLGGGFMRDEVVLLAGEPGIGKSTLLLQIAGMLSAGNTFFETALGGGGSLTQENTRRRSRSTVEGAPEKIGVGQGDRLRGVSQNGFPPKASVLYVAGEESPSQIKNRADRLGIQATGITVLVETRVEEIIDYILTQTSSNEVRPQPGVGDRTSAPLHKDGPVFPVVAQGKTGPSLGSQFVVIIDSVQTLESASVDSSAGSPAQVRECAQQLSQLSKRFGFILILVGHVTKDGAIAGPKVLEHVVDAVLYLEGDSVHAFRLLRVTKNRFGSTDEVGVFAMGEKGFEEVKNPSALFLEGKLKNSPGSVVCPVVSGNRCFLVEVQALTVSTTFAMPRRTVSGVSLNRVLLIIAVLQSRAGINLSQHDVFVSVAGGLRVDDVGLDLAVALALYSGYKQKSWGEKTAAFGELGLSGEIRHVARAEGREKEGRKLGYEKFYSPQTHRSVRDLLKDSS